MRDILLIAGRKPWPPDDGWKIRTFFLLKALAGLGGAVDLLVFDETGEPDRCGGLRGLCREIRVVPRTKAYSFPDLLRGLVFRRPFSVLNYADAAFSRALRELTSRHDYGCVQVEDVVMAQYAEELQGVRRILDMHNIESDLLRRYAENTRSLARKLYAGNAAGKLERYERRVAERFDAVLVCSAEERQALRRKGLRTPVEVVPNGVDAKFYGDVPASGEDALVFVGSMDYHANISGILFFAAEILPLLKKARPSLAVYVVGKNPPPEIRALADDTLVVTGGVEDVRPYLGRGAVSIVPLLVGGGTRLKILEAMAAGLPVVSTSLGAEGLPVRNGENIMIADRPEAFAGQVLRLLEHPDERAALARNGRAFALANYDWPVVGERLTKLVKKLLGADA